MTFFKLIGVIENLRLPLCTIPTTGIVAKTEALCRSENNFLMVG